MLRIYPVSLAMVAEVTPYVERIARRDRDLARQLRVEEGEHGGAAQSGRGFGTRGGRRRNTYEIALGEARETRACLQVAEAIGYVGKMTPGLADKLDHVIATLVKLVR